METNYHFSTFIQLPNWVIETKQISNTSLNIHFLRQFYLRQIEEKIFLWSWNFISVYLYWRINYKKKSGLTLFYNKLVHQQGWITSKESCPSFIHTALASEKSVWFYLLQLYVLVSERTLLSSLSLSLPSDSLFFNPAPWWSLLLNGWHFFSFYFLF